MATKSTNISIRMDETLKMEADALFHELGMNLTTAFTIFVRQCLREKGIPFDIHIAKPDVDTVQAILEAQQRMKEAYKKD